MQIKGNSGAILTIKNNKIIKDHPLLKHKQRLKQQKNKQLYFLKKYKFKNIYTPKVFPNKNIFIMEMIKNSKNFLQFIEKADKSQIDILIKSLNIFLEKSITESVYKNIKFNLIKNKYESIDKKEFKSKLDKLFKKFKYNKILIPCGFCHGDLSLANILFLNKKIYFIDFLNTFLDSPIQDMVKLRQDTKHYWMTHIQNIKSKKIISKLKYMDKEFDKRFNKFKFYKKFYKLFQFLNLTRILPYAKSYKNRKYLYKSIKSLF